MANELILIVEDNPKNLKLVRDTPQVKGYLLKVLTDRIIIAGRHRWEH
jgi:CheY-like chemotaxis protein